MDFLDHARAHGLIIKHLQPDNLWHRVPTTDHPRKKNGAYCYDGNTGAVQNWATETEPSPWRPNGERAVRPIMIRQKAADAAKEEARRHEKARQEAARIIKLATPQTHPYLVRKGFPTATGLVYNGDLIVPMWVFEGQMLVGLQSISADGHKLFLPGTRAKGAAFVLGDPRRHLWLVEGYATGLSVHAALGSMYRKDAVVVCFSAGNLIEIANRCRKNRAVVIADNDASGTGEKAARETKLPWAMPPEVGTDANDFHQRDGLPALINLMRGLL